MSSTLGPLGTPWTTSATSAAPLGLPVDTALRAPGAAGLRESGQRRWRQ
ncbi:MULTISPECIES: hypothetical protein [Actinomyces]|uniref:Uncharacterized protein n=1 Tax=Actinomyces respiraculi TaxID=2744574 RepID=A0A7T0LJ09_9ACTO|nr:MULTISPECIES: hypothetical protein [Actinomyces]QPL04485.1 hypothetical protein ID810_06555 [Actinomyces respiraculi]